MTAYHRLDRSESGTIAARFAAQVRSSLALMLAVYTPAAILLGIIAVVWLREDIPISEFTRDPLQTLDAPVYTGIVSNIGAIVWSATAGICFFSYAVSRNISRSVDETRFLLAAGAVTTMLLLDDFFILHEMEFGGLPQEGLYLLYAASMIWLAVRYRAVILATNIVFLALAYFWFGLSIFVDVTETILPYPSVYFFEDGAKLAGIVSWATYFVSVSVARVRLLMSPAPVSPPYH